MSFPEFMQWSFLGVVSCGVFIMWQMNGSIQEIATTLAVVVNKQEYQEKRSDGHETRIVKLEEKP